MDFLSVILFLILYYIRPQEWIPGFEVLRPVTLVMAMALASMLLRKQGFRLSEMLKTPHDKLMLAYFVWILFSATAVITTLSSIYNIFLFYLVTVLALSTIDRIRIYLLVWTGLILTIALLALASLHGLDLMGSYDLTHGPMKGRLSLNLSIFKNPNALGHSVAPVLLLLYFVFIWKRPVFSRVWALPLLLFPLYCIYLTSSKGAFLASFAMILAGFCFGRSRLIQMWIVIGAITVGWAAVSQLPRMEELSQGTREEGIAGRVVAFRFGHEAMLNNLTGVGYNNFVEGVYRKYRNPISPHSSYVNVGAQTGLPGLFLFLGILYCCFRTLVWAKTTTVEEERIRRMLFVLLVSYVFSSWMIDWAFRAYFFLIVAAIAAFHRHLLSKNHVTAPETELAVNAPFSPLPASPRPALATASTSMTPAAPSGFLPPLPTSGNSAVSGPAVSPTGDSLTEKGAAIWNRIRFIDLGLILALTWATIYFWRYAMRHI